MNPVSIGIDINNACNSQCQFCRLEHGNKEMGLDQLRSIVQENPQARYIGISGGEPLLHSHFEEILRAVRSINPLAQVCVSTNLTTDVEKLLSLSRREGRYTVQVNVPTVDPTRYCNITGRDVFSQVEQNLLQVKEHLPLMVNCVVYQSNFHHVEQLIDYVLQNWDVPVRVDLAYPVGPARSLSILTPDQVLALTHLISRKQIEAGTRGGLILSGLRFEDHSCTKVVIPCTANARYFGGVEAGCNHEKRFYDVDGRMHRCEFGGE
jgi:molybdenum cofactor biosynthesis enzyme MoaA